MNYNLMCLNVHTPCINLLYVYIGDMDMVGAIDLGYCITLFPRLVCPTSMTAQLQDHCQVGSELLDSCTSFGSSTLNERQ